MLRCVGSMKLPSYLTSLKVGSMGRRRVHLITRTTAMPARFAGGIHTSVATSRICSTVVGTSTLKGWDRKGGVFAVARRTGRCVRSRNKGIVIALTFRPSKKDY